MSQYPQLEYTYAQVRGGVKVSQSATPLRDDIGEKMNNPL